MNNATWSMGNFDNDGDTDLVDLGILAGNYESGVQQAMSDFQRIVPEPNSVYVLPLALLGAGVIGGLERRVRKR